VTLEGTQRRGSNRWPAAHVLDVGRLYRLALEKAPARSQLYAATEEGVARWYVAERVRFGQLALRRDPHAAVEQFPTITSHLLP